MGWIGTKERKNKSSSLSLIAYIAAALNPINAIAPPWRRSARAMEDAAAATKELSFSCFYTLSGDVSVRVSEDLATAYKPLFGTLYSGMDSIGRRGR